MNTTPHKPATNTSMHGIDVEPPENWVLIDLDGNTVIRAAMVPVMLNSTFQYSGCSKKEEGTDNLFSWCVVGGQGMVHAREGYIYVAEVVVTV